MAQTDLPEPSARDGQLDPRRWRALLFIAIAQLMVVLDATIVNIALPSVQADLGLSDGNRQWVVTAYSLAFGGLLLLGGRIADTWGRKRTFLTGLVGFAGASALGGAAGSEAMLFAARALQGVFGAMLAPAALSLLAVTFMDPKERAKAFGVFGAIAGGGAAVGLTLGGLLTEYVDWRWVFYVNIPIAALAVFGAMAEIRDHGGRNRSPLDLPGAVLGTSGLVALVYGFSRAESHGWTDDWTLGMFASAVVLLASFVFTERRVSAPLLPLRVVLNRNRAGAYLAVGLGVIAMFGLFLFLTYYMQVVKDYSPIRTGVAFLPMVAGMLIGSTQIGARLVTRVPARALMGPGLLVAASGMLILTQLEVDSPYLQILPALVLLGIGMGSTFMPAVSVAVSEVDARDTGIASAMMNTSQQVGGAIGIALLNTIAATATTAFVASNAGDVPQQALQLEGMVHGFTTALWWAVGILVLAATLAVTLVRSGSRRSVRGSVGDEVAPAPTQ